MSKDELLPDDVDETRIWKDEEKLRRYLLGTSSPEESDEIEHAMLVEDLSPILDVIQDEIVEDYVTGELDNFERSHFEKQLLFRRDLIQKIRVTAMLLGKQDAVKNLGQSASNPPRKSTWVQILTQSLGELPSKHDPQLALFDRSYVERLRGRDPTTVEDFVNCFTSILEQKIGASLKSQQAVDDVRRETFARVLKVLSNPTAKIQPEQLGAFVNTVCQNVLTEYYRPNLDGSTPRKEDDEVSLAGAGVPDSIASEPDKEDYPEAQQQLTPTDRLTLRMIFIENRNKDEICRELGVDREYLRLLLHRARKAFKKAYPDIGQKRA